jgi:hypothetical protein
MTYFKHFPLFYFCRGGVSDRALIESALREIPSSKHEQVVNRYSELYSQNGYIHVSQGRTEANEYLARVVAWCQQKRAEVGYSSSERAEAYEQHKQAMAQPRPIKNTMPSNHPAAGKRSSNMPAHLRGAILRNLEK